MLEVDVIALDDIVKGTVETRASNSLVTDSAASATAYSCGLKTYNNAIGVLDNQTACGTIMEAAKLSGRWRTALVTTSRITHATPASFSAHTRNRFMENEIAVQQATQQQVDLLFGGGWKYFISRTDQRNLFSEMEARGYTTTTNYSQFLTLTHQQLPLIGLFNRDHIEWEIDRVQQSPVIQPGLTEMATKALDILTAASQSDHKPFFMMVEAARIDMADHIHDAAASYWELKQYMQLIATLKDYVAQHPNTIVVALADHETGGMSLGASPVPPFIYPEYWWDPSIIRGVTASAEMMASQILAGQSITSTLWQEAGIALSTEETEQIQNAIDTTGSQLSWVALTIGNIIGLRAGVGWTTPGHTGLDINLHHFGLPLSQLAGNLDNTHINHILTHYLNLHSDLAAVTTSLAALYDPNTGTTSGHAASSSAAPSSSTRNVADATTPLAYFSHS